MNKTTGPLGSNLCSLFPNRTGGGAPSSVRSTRTWGQGTLPFLFHSLSHPSSSPTPFLRIITFIMSLIMRNFFVFKNKCWLTRLYLVYGSRRLHVNVPKDNSFNPDLEVVGRASESACLGQLTWSLQAYWSSVLFFRDKCKTG